MYASSAITAAKPAGISEKRDQTILRTESVTEAGSMLVLPIASVIILAPDRPSSKAMSEPDSAVPSFWAMVPEEKIRPVDEVPNFSVE